MDFAKYRISFEKAASNSGYSAENINRCLEYAKVLIANNVPIIYNTSHLSALVGYRKEYLKRAAKFSKSFYFAYQIKKKNGKLRTISEPLPSLKEIQLWILENILQGIKVSPFAKAYRKDVRITENVRYHQKQPKVLTLDLRDFFSSIAVESVENIFLSVGYSRLIANLLAKLCTRERILPQGAPTSPYLSNIYFHQADSAIANHCLSNNIRYTRYADDLSFSGQFDETTIISLVKEEIRKLGLTLNEEKTSLMLPHQRQMVTGIVVNEKLQVAFFKRNSLRQNMYFIKKFGLDNHIKHQKIRKANYLEHLLGQINFVLQINPSDVEFQEYKSFLIQLRKSN